MWTDHQEVTPTPEEVASIALVLESEHGLFAADIAEFYATHHGLDGDAGRSWAWTGVAECIREREQRRIAVDRGW